MALSIHYGKHHQGYVDNLTTLIKNSEMDELRLEEIIIATFDVWEHAYFLDY